jgi:hypothetical protein
VIPWAKRHWTYFFCVSQSLSGRADGIGQAQHVLGWSLPSGFFGTLAWGRGTGACPKQELFQKTLATTCAAIVENHLSSGGYLS